MANREHTRVVRRGTQALADFMAENPDTTLDLEHADLRKADLDRALLLGANLKSVELQDACLQGASFLRSKLTNAELFRADLTDAELNEVCLRGADLRYAKLDRADLKQADLRGANLTRAHLTEADLRGCDLRGADLEGASLIGANLKGAKIQGARLVAANFADCYVAEVDYDRDHWECSGVNVSTCYGNPFFKRDAEDQDYIEHFAAEHPWLFGIWSFSCDCGRSLIRVLAIAVVLVVCYGMLYGQSSFGLMKVHSTVDTWFTPYYYSIVIFTTLGFGDITPGSLVGQFVVASEVLFGYATLGLFVSILANQVARRA